ncbi:MAG: GNAT family N-acetyltransferase [Chitinophagaceae bacterium]|nr:GNAT family N-acetyltransferase [Oligoflexus sp.]
MSEDEFIIREARPEDNERLIDLARRCPMQGQFEMYTDRYPDFFATNRIQGEKAHIYVVERPADGDLVACVAFTEKHEKRGDKTIKVLHIGDLRTDPTLRRSKIAARLILIYRDMLYSGAYDHGMVEILEGNNAAINTHKLLGDDFAVNTEGKIIFYQLLPVRGYWPSKEFSYRQATAFDMPSIAALMQKSYGGAPGAPEFTVGWLKKQFAKHPSFTIKDVWLAVDKNQTIVASAGLWDQSSFRRTIVSNYTRAMKTGVRLLAFFGLLWKLPPAPKEGQALSYTFIRWPAAPLDKVGALGELTRFLVNRVRSENRHQFLSVGFNEFDPLQTSLEGITKVKENIQVFSHWLKKSEAYQDVGEIPAQRRFVDLTLI